MLWFILFTIVGLFIQGYFTNKSREAAAARWTRFASERGLTYTDRTLEGPRITGPLREFNVCVSTYLDRELFGPGRKMERMTRIVVSGDGKLDPELKIVAETGWTELKKLVRGNDVQTQDAPFDARVHLRGSEPRVLALMNHKARLAALACLKAGDGSVQDGRVTLEGVGTWEKANLEQLVDVTVKLAEQLVLPTAATAQALAENAFSDPLPEVRMRNRECLSAQLCAPERGALYAALDGPQPLNEETARAALAALTDADPKWRLLGAMLTPGEPSFAVLKALSEDDSAAPELSARALVTLMTRFPWERALPSVTLALTSDREPVVTAALTGIGTAHEGRLLAPVCALAAAASAALLTTIAKTLSALASAEAEPTLLKMLEHDADEVRIAAAKALGEMGTIRAVEPLLLVQGKLLSEVKTTAQQAARTIQGRLGDAEAGRLSVVDHQDPGGALSLVSPGGGLSLPKQAAAAAAVHCAEPRSGR